MCYEDIKLGFRRYSTTKSNPVSIGADSSRVLIRMVTGTGVTGAGFAIGLRSGGAGDGGIVMSVGGGMPVDELSLETHGITVQGAFTFSGGISYFVTEVFDRQLNQAPGDYANRGE